jgi:hypothetical protein
MLFFLNFTFNFNLINLIACYELQTYKEKDEIILYCKKNKLNVEVIHVIESLKHNLILLDGMFVRSILQ